jgi:hypothetical protein
MRRWNGAYDGQLEHGVPHGIGSMIHNEKEFTKGFYETNSSGAVYEGEWQGNKTMSSQRLKFKKQSC